MLYNRFEVKIMKAQFYIDTVNRMRENGKLGSAVVSIGKAATAFVYVFYPLMLVVLAVVKSQNLIKAIIVPAVSFAIVSVLRYFLNFPRPYEKIKGLISLYNKKTVGKSFPSRHTFSAFCIAVTTLYFNSNLGLFLFLVGAVLGLCRVLSGVHFIRDVVVGAVFGTLCGAFGMYCF